MKGQREFQVKTDAQWPNKHHFTLCFYAFWNWSSAKHQELADRNWSVGHHLRTPDIMDAIITYN